MPLSAYKHQNFYGITFFPFVQICVDINVKPIFSLQHTWKAKPTYLEVLLKWKGKNKQTHRLKKGRGITE